MRSYVRRGRHRAVHRLRDDALLEQNMCRTKVRTVLELSQPAHCVEDALRVYAHPHMAQAPILFVTLFLPPAQVLWVGMDVNHVAPTEAASDDEKYRLMAEVIEPADAPVVGVSSSST